MQASPVLVRQLPYLGQVALMAAVYLMVARLSLALAIPPGYATAVWPPSGIALAAALLVGQRIWPGIWIGAALANVAVESSIFSAFLIASGNTLEALVGAALIGTQVRAPDRFERAEDVVRFVALGAVAATIPATVAQLPLAFGHPLSLPEAFRNWWTWWQGDLAGILIVAPLILSWNARDAQAWPPQKKMELICFGLLLLGSAAALTADDRGQLAPFALTFMALPFIVWAACRFGQREVTTAIAVVCAVAVWYIVERRDLFASAPLNELLLMLLTFITLVVTTALVLVAVVGERRRASDELRRKHDELESQVRRHGRYDFLTGLPNAALFRERLAQLLGIAAESGRKVAVAAIDIARFESVNDAFGRRTGDELLRQIAARLSQEHAGNGIVARLEGDRFAIAVHGFENESAVARAAADRLARWFGTPYSLADNELRVSAQMGLALFPDDGHEAEALCMHAESALKKAKAAGERYLFYTQKMSERVAEKLSLESRLRRAIERQEFVLHYQPTVRLDSKQVVGVEALIRWMSPELGLVPPMQFIPLLEETGMILEVGRWALTRAVLDQGLWGAEGVRVPRIAVNVSAIQLRQRNFVDVVQEAIGSSAAPSLIDLEITESRIMEDIDANIVKLTRIRDLGMGISIDDFGTGYSSLAYLARLPIKTLKIDRSFIAKMLDDEQAMMLVQTIISLARSVKLTTVAEGVESEEQADVLELLGCDQMQGYFIGKPLPRQEVSALLRG